MESTTTGDQRHQDNISNSSNSNNNRKKHDRDSAITLPQRTPRKRRKRQRQQPQPQQPSFCDATTSVVASTFAASRLEEIQALYSHYRQQQQQQHPTNSPPRMTATPTTAVMLDSQVYKSGGCQTASRHLRRRATSHNPSVRRRHRYPRGDGPNPVATALVDGGGNKVDTKNHHPTPPMARQNHQRQPPSLSHLSSSDDSGVVGSAADGMDLTIAEKTEEKLYRKQSRRSRRGNRSLLKWPHEQWQRQSLQLPQQLPYQGSGPPPPPPPLPPPAPPLLPTPSAAHNSGSRQDDQQRQHRQHDDSQRPTATAEAMHALPSHAAVAKGPLPCPTKSSMTMIRPRTTSSTSTNASTTRTTTTRCHWMPTHLWHAKRFHMELLWGWKVPMVHNNRGAQAALRLCRQGKCLVQDVTWKMQPICCQVTTRSTTTTSNVGSRNEEDNRQRKKAATAASFPATVRILSRVIPDMASSPSPVRPSNEMGRCHNNQNLMTTGGQGMFHELDQFPLGAIGPVQWLITINSRLWLDDDFPGPKRQFGGSNNDNDSNAARQGLQWTDQIDVVDDDDCCNCYIYFFVHPTMVDSCWSNLERLLSCPLPPDIIIGGLRSLKRGLAYFQLRGRAAEECLTKTVSTFHAKEGQNDGSMFHWMDLMIDETAETIGIAQLARGCNDDGDDDDDRHRNESHIWNHWVHGFDVLCRPSVAAQLFISLVIAGGACPIGSTEASHLGLECDPPRLLFPRDFPDTPSGRAYWTTVARNTTATTTRRTNKNARKDENEDCAGGEKLPGSAATMGGRDKDDDWAVVRRYYEGGIGRIPTAHEPGCQRLAIDWTTLIPFEQRKLQLCKDQTADTNSAAASSPVVMMRGMFGKPIVDLLRRNSRNIESRSVESKPGQQQLQHRKLPQPQRRRRPTKNPIDSVGVPPPCRRGLESYQIACQSLCQSLSLPAILVAHVRMEQHGAGKLIPGAAVVSWSPPGVANRSNHNINTHPSEATVRQPGDCGNPPAQATHPRYLLLGYITTGEFSHHRGRCHGLAVLGAAAFLEALRQAPERQALVHVREFATSVAQTTPTITTTNNRRSTKAAGTTTIRLLAQASSSSCTLDAATVALDGTQWRPVSLCPLL